MNNQLSAEQVLKEKGFIMITTAGVSMRPLLRDRCDRVIIKPISQPLKKYDVPLYRRGEELVLHRILKIEGDTLIIRGDNCVNLEYVDVNNVIGVLTEFYRGNKHYTVDSRVYKLYSRVWVFLYPVILFFKKSRAKAGKIYRKIWRKNG